MNGIAALALTLASFTSVDDYGQERKAAINPLAVTRIHEVSCPPQSLHKKCVRIFHEPETNTVVVGTYEEVVAMLTGQGASQ